jgi:hypothetical protein
LVGGWQRQCITEIKRLRHYNLAGQWSRQIDAELIGTDSQPGKDIWLLRLR